MDRRDNRRKRDKMYREPQRKAGGRRPLVRRRVLSPTNFLLALIGFLFIFSFSVVLVLNLRQIYYYDVQALHLPEETGLSEEQIRANYDGLIDYNLFWKGKDKLEFPDFPMSEHGEIHFEEVKRIFVGIQYLMIVSAVLFLGGLLKKIRNRDYGCLKLTAVFTPLIPIVLGVLAVMNWEQFFVGFHRLMFSNDYWLFDPVTDPVIWILPDEFFFHCAAAIILCVLLGGLLMEALYRAAARKGRK